MYPKYIFNPHVYMLHHIWLHWYSTQPASTNQILCVHDRDIAHIHGVSVPHMHVRYTRCVRDMVDHNRLLIL